MHLPIQKKKKILPAKLILKILNNLINYKKVIFRGIIDFASIVWSMKAEKFRYLFSNKCFVKTKMIEFFKQF